MTRITVACYNTILLLFTVDISTADLRRFVMIILVSGLYFVLLFALILLAVIVLHHIIFWFGMWIGITILTLLAAGVFFLLSKKVKGVKGRIAIAVILTLLVAVTPYSDRIWPFLHGRTVKVCIVCHGGREKISISDILYKVPDGDYISAADDGVKVMTASESIFQAWPKLYVFFIPKKTTDLVVIAYWQGKKYNVHPTKGLFLSNNSNYVVHGGWPFYADKIVLSKVCLYELSSYDSDKVGLLRR